MVGREKEQLNALKTLSDQSFSGRNGSNEELKQQMAMLTLLNKLVLVPFKVKRVLN